MLSKVVPDILYMEHGAIDLRILHLEFPRTITRGVDKALETSNVGGLHLQLPLIYKFCGGESCILNQFW